LGKSSIFFLAVLPEIPEMTPAFLRKELFKGCWELTASGLTKPP
jgi:hypothetical protein